MQHRRTQRQPSRRSATLLPLSALLFSACSSTAAESTVPDERSEIAEDIHLSGPFEIDILFVVDSSASMVEEQAAVAGQLETMLRETLAADYYTQPPNLDLHVGVITADASDPETSGVLHAAGRLPGCDPSFTALDCERDEECPWLSHSLFLPDDGTDVSNPPLWEDLACIAAVGTDGGAQERPFDAIIAALTTQSQPGRPNHGFLRDDSHLVLVFITDEDDCSGLELSDDAEPGVECLLREDELMPAADVHDALLELRGGDENRLAVSAIVGIPVDGSWDPGDPLVELRDLRRIEGNRPAPSCEGERGLAYPPPRLAELVYAAGNNGILESICREDWSWAFAAVSWWEIDLQGVCLPRLLQPDDIRTCRVELIQEDLDECLGLADAAGPERTTGWSVDLGLDDEGRRRCEILPADLDVDGCPDGALECPPDWEPSDGGLDGWFVDWTSSGCEHGVLKVTERLMTAIRGELRIRCVDDPCPEVRSCPRALSDASSCEEGCGDGAVCVEHISGEICGWIELPDGMRRPLQCSRCSSTLGSACSMASPASGAPRRGLAVSQFRFEKRRKLLVEQARDLNRHAEWGIALENLCGDFWEKDPPVKLTAEVHRDIVALARDLGLRSDYYENLMELVEESR
jgi:hypothetical protein